MKKFENENQQSKTNFFRSYSKNFISVLSLILAILSLLFVFFIPWLSIFCGVTAMVLGIIALIKNTNKKWIPIIGLCGGFLAILLSVFSITNTIASENNKIRELELQKKNEIEYLEFMHKKLSENYYLLLDIEAEKANSDYNILENNINSISSYQKKITLPKSMDSLDNDIKKIVSLFRNDNKNMLNSNSSLTSTLILETILSIEKDLEKINLPETYTSYKSQKTIAREKAEVKKKEEEIAQKKAAEEAARVAAEEARIAEEEAIRIAAEAARIAEEEAKRAQMEQQQAQVVHSTVVLSQTGTKYHRPGCRTLKLEPIPTTVEEAQALGYEACKVCKP